VYKDINLVKDLCSVVITVYNECEFLKKCIGSLMQKADLSLEIIVVDGGSDKEIVKEIFDHLLRVEYRFAQTKFITTRVRTPAAHCINIGIDASRGEHLFIANDDILVETKNWCSRMVFHAVTNPHAAVVGCVGTKTYHKQSVQRKYDTEEFLGKAFESDQVAGTLCYINRDAMSKIGKYDENLGYQGGGDADYSVRAAAYGYELLIAKDVKVKHLNHGTLENFSSMKQHISKKYDVEVISPDNVPKCIKRARHLYSNESKDAVAVWAYKCPIIDKTVESLVKYTPEDIPIYILDQAAPDMVVEKERMKEVAEKYKGRVDLYECFISESKRDAPLSIIKFLVNHLNVDRLLKIDDDVIVSCDVYTGLKEAYENKPNTLFSVGLSPIQIWGLEIFKERLKLNGKLDSSLYKPLTMYEEIVRRPQHAKQIWEATTPPDVILPKLRSGNRFVKIPNINRNWGMFHYFAHRSDILSVGGVWDETKWQKKYNTTLRPRVMDTWSLVYHFAWFKWYEYAMKEIYPLVKSVDF